MRYKGVIIMLATLWLTLPGYWAVIIFLLLSIPALKTEIVISLHKHLNPMDPVVNKMDAS